MYSGSTENEKKNIELDKILVFVNKDLFKCLKYSDFFFITIHAHKIIV